MFERIRLLLIGAVAVGALVLSASPAAAMPYNSTPPSFDGLTMLRVAYGYNVTKAYDLKFPAKSDQACEIAGVGTMTWVSGDHGIWANVKENNDALNAVYEEALDATGGGHFLPCYMLRSESLGKLVAGLPRVWPATLKQNFNKLRKALRKGNCETAIERLGRYPRIALPGKQIRRAVRVSAGGSCKRR